VFDEEHYSDHSKKIQDFRSASGGDHGDEVTDFDDIPVSKIPTKSSIDDSLASKDGDDLNDTHDSQDEHEGADDTTPKKRKYRKSEGK
jgi:hypothetical protein